MRLFIIPLLALISGLLEAQTVGYSATALQSDTSGKETMQVKMYVSADGMQRTEGIKNGQHFVQIVVPSQGVMWVVLPDQKAYIERRGVSTPPAADAASKNPCSGRPGFSCTLLGEEKVNGRPASKWEIVATLRGQSVRALQWMDKEHGLVLRQQRSDGSRLEMKLLDKEKLSGRAAEKWETVMTPAGGSKEAVRSLQWYDPQLKAILRQKLPNGGVSELRDIKVAPQPKELFELPSGYRQLQM